MSENIVVLTGSPRQGGNSDMLAEAFVKGARESGKNVNVFKTADLKISGCLGCEYCFDNEGICFQNDDMGPILTALRETDVMVLVSPVYYFSISAQLKTAIDRTYALLEVKPPIKKAALLLTCADETTDVAEGAVVTFKNICKYSKWENAGIIIATGVGDIGDIKGRKELDQAEKLGLEI